jgi:hypothetical protein
MFFDCAGIYGSVNVVDDPEDAISHFFIFHASVNVKMSSGDRDIYWILVLSNSMTGANCRPGSVHYARTLQIRCILRRKVVLQKLLRID